jgi:predicted dehydrogenase
MEAMWMRYVPAMVKLRELLAAGAVGDARYLTADLGAPAGAEPKARIVDPELGGGALLQTGIYLISLASMVFGRPDRVASLADPGATGVDAHAGVLLGYPGGRLALLLCSIVARPLRQATVVGTAGLIRIHPPVICPPGLTLRRGPVGRSSSPAFRLPESLVRYGKRNRLVRRLRERYSMLGELLVHGIRTRVIRAPVAGEGLWYQAREVMRCLQAGRTESDVMPLEESVAILETADEIRRQWTFR